MAAALLQTDSLTNHPDLLLLEPDDKETIKIDAARKLIRRMNLKPSQAAFTITIIDRCECLTTEASNALLKSLEEPAGTVFLITSRPGALLPTIRSRCQRFKFAPLPDDIIKELLDAQQDWDAKRLESSVAIAAGSLALASQIGTTLQELDVDLPTLFEELTTHSYSRMEERLRQLPSDPEGVTCLLAGFRQLCRNRLVQTDGGATAPWFACLDAISAAETALRYNSAPLLVWETLAFSFQKVLKSAAVI